MVNFYLKKETEVGIVSAYSLKSVKIFAWSMYSIYKIDYENREIDRGLSKHDSSKA